MWCPSAVSDSLCGRVRWSKVGGQVIGQRIPSLEGNGLLGWIGRALYDSEAVERLDDSDCGAAQKRRDASHLMPLWF